MKILYISLVDHKKISNWSGTYYYISKALEMQQMEIEYITDIFPEIPFTERIKRKFYATVLGKTYNHLFTKKVIRNLRNQLNQLVEKSNADIIFSPSSIPMALLNTTRPKVVYTDACFAAMINFYPDYIKLPNRFKNKGNELEQGALNKCSRVIYSSNWAAEAAIKFYSLDPAKVKVIPFGANVENLENEEDVRARINQKDINCCCRLLFIGVDWERKGGNVALEVTEQLNRLGLKTELWVVGCLPKMNGSMPNFVKLYGFISKESDEGKKKIEQLLSEAHFLIVPSLAEAYGLVFCEANAYGLPCISTNVGGIPTIIKDEVNGKLFPPFELPLNIAHYIMEIYNDKAKYEKLAMSSFNEYKERLNWKVAGGGLKNIFEELI
ncbi:MAG TPA: glycosyltransferase family 4 protein [Bacteroidales bacterium]